MQDRYAHDEVLDGTLAIARSGANAVLMLRSTSYVHTGGDPFPGKIPRETMKYINVKPIYE
jgi:hypothetical protein